MNGALRLTPYAFRKKSGFAIVCASRASSMTAGKSGRQLASGTA